MPGDERDDGPTVNKRPPGWVHGGYHSQSRIAEKPGSESPPDSSDTSQEESHILATTRPDLSLLMIKIDPADKTLLRQFAIIGFREELMHSSRQSFGLTRNVRLLRRQCYETLLAYLAGEIDVAEAKSTIVEYWSAAEAIHTERLALLETVDQYLTHITLEDREYLTAQAEEFFDDPVDRVVFLDGLQEEYESGRDQIPLPTVYDALLELEASYSQSTAIAVADAALDVPFLVNPLTNDEVHGTAERLPVRDFEDVDLERRFWKGRQVVDQLDRELASTPTDQLVPILRQQIAGRETPFAVDLQSVALPLLDMPASLQYRDGTDSRGLSHTRSMLSDYAHLLTDAFGPEGQFGGSMFRIGSGPEEWNWLVNPDLWNTELPTDHPTRVGDVDTYEEYWQLNVLCDHIIGQLLHTDPSPAESTIYCPFCHHSYERDCADSTCGVQPYIERTQEVEHVFGNASPAYKQP